MTRRGTISSDSPPPCRRIPHPPSTPPLLSRLLQPLSRVATAQPPPAVAGAGACGGRAYGRLGRRRRHMQHSGAGRGGAGRGGGHPATRGAAIARDARHVTYARLDCKAPAPRPSLRQFLLPPSSPARQTRPSPPPPPPPPPPPRCAAPRRRDTFPSRPASAAQRW